MEEIKNTQEEPQKATYEQLENYVQQLSQQNIMLRKRLQEFDREDFYKKMDYLFKVVKNKEAFPVEFVNNCVSTIIDAMTPEEPSKEDSNATEG